MRPIPDATFSKQRLTRPLDQVSNTGPASKVFRATALRHALLSYLSGVVIIATLINRVAGLSK